MFQAKKKKNLNLHANMLEKICNAEICGFF